MSRKAGGVSFVSKGQFDVLGGEETNNSPSEPEEETPVTMTKSEDTSTPSRSKSTKKRLAKAAAKMGFRSGSTPTKVAAVNEEVAYIPPVPPVPQKEITVGQPEINGVTPIAAGTAVKPGLTDPVPLVAPIPQKPLSPVLLTGTVHPESEVDAYGGRTTPKAIGSSFTPPPPPEPLPHAANSSMARSSLSEPPTSDFSPDLPKDVTLPPSSLVSSGSLSRKRKQPGDFTPSGSNAEKASSPNKLGVKFEDGIAPGEGKEGEVVIEKKNRNVVERTIWTFIMIGGFIALLCLGQPYMILLVMLCQTLVYKEVTALFELRDEGTQQMEDGDMWSKTLNWYFFVVTNYFLYGESIIYYFKHIVFVDAYFIPFAQNHRFISFMLYMVGFVGFVANLQRQYLRQQFALFCWVHISLLLIVVSSHFIVNNILEGHVWFFVPASLVICNDVMAYVCGKLFGRTPLIKLSPKKTVEGFVGAFIATLIFGLAWGTFFMRFPYMICPARDLGTNVFSHVTCKPNPVFVWREFEFTGAARHILESVLGHSPPKIPYAPFQIHCLVMATFASLVAPFGGFFASGFKRAFNIKDFGHSIPGHGGMTDRMDCQFLMGLFSYVYYSSLIRIQNVTVGSILQMVVTSLTMEEQLELFNDVKLFLKGQGVRA